MEPQEPQVQTWTLKRKTFPVKIEAEDGNVKTILVREMSCAERSEYFAGMSDKVTINAEGGLEGIKSFRGLHTLLLKLTLVDAINQQPIPVEEFGAYPGGLSQFLYNKARELNGFGDKDVLAKKDLQGKT